MLPAQNLIPQSNKTIIEKKFFIKVIPLCPSVSSIMKQVIRYTN